MKVPADHELRAVACVCAGVAFTAYGWWSGRDFSFHIGLAFFVLGFGALAIDRLFNRHVVSLLEAIRGLMVGRKEHGLVRVYRCRRDPELGAELLRLVRSLGGGGTHEVCLSGIAGLLLLPSGPWPAVAREFVEALLKPRSEAHTIRIHVLLTYPYSIAARNRAVAEAMWKRPCVQRSPFSAGVAPTPPAFENDLTYYRETRLYRDCQDALRFWQQLRQRLTGTNVTLSVHFCTQDPECALLRIDDVLFQEGYQLGRLSLECNYVTGQLPIQQYSPVAPGSDSEFGAAPFHVYKNHFEYLRKSVSTLVMDQVLVEHHGGVDFKLPVDLRGCAEARTQIPLQRMGAVRVNCFAVPSRRLFQRMSAKSLHSAGLTVSCRGRDCTALLVDIGPGGLRLRVDTTILDADLLQGIAVSGVDHGGRSWTEGVSIAEVVLQQCDGDDEDGHVFRVTFAHSLPRWACQVLERATKSAVTS